MNDERLAQLGLSSCPGIGGRTLRKLQRSFPTWHATWSANRTAFLCAGLSELMTDRLIAWRQKIDPAELAQHYAQAGIQFLFPNDPAFPRLLRSSSDPPGVLFVRGTLTDLPFVSIVGTRRLTAYGRHVIQTIVPELARTGIGIVSGLAIGVDAFTHATTLDADGYTLAVLGAGIDDTSIYPRQNYQLAQRILHQGGCLVSEFPPGTEARKEFFPIRNRIIAGLSLATLVIEAAEESGSLITAKLALEENREVLAVPGPIWSKTSTGTHALIQGGAKLCASAKDVLESIAIDRPALVAQARASLPLDPNEERILSLLNEPRHIDDLAILADLAPAQASAKLSLLELKGLVAALGGQVWSLSGKSRF